MKNSVAAAIAFLLGFAVGFIVSRALIEPGEPCIYVSLESDSNGEQYSTWIDLAKENGLSLECTEPAGINGSSCTALRICTLPPPDRQ